MASSLALLLTILFQIISLAAAQCMNPPVIFNFGDSNSDTGGAAVLLGGPYVYPDGNTFFDEPTGRLCDGRLIIDFLCESLNTKYLTPYIQTFDRNFSNGVNFALSGSSTTRPQSDNPFALNIQISEFSRFRNQSIYLGCRGHQNLLREDDFKYALYAIDIGQNDLAAAFKERTYESVLRAVVPFVVSKIRSAILAIYHLGGKNFWVHGTGPLGCLPSQLATRNASESLDKYGCISNQNEAAKQLNLELDRMCQELRFQMGISTIVYVDVYLIKYDLITSSCSYGLEHPLMAWGGPNITCGVAQGQRQVSWDGTHYTEAANAIIASKILSTNYSSPPLPFSFFCNNPT